MKKDKLGGILLTVVLLLVFPVLIPVVLFLAAYVALGKTSDVTLEEYEKRVSLAEEDAGSS